MGGVPSTPRCEEYVCEGREGVPFWYVYRGQEFSAEEVGLKKVEFTTLPFSWGKFRTAYQGRVYFEACQPDHPSEALKQLLSCWDFTEDACRDFDWDFTQERLKASCCIPCIVKEWRRSHARYAHEWEQDLEVLKEAQSKSQKFNKAGIAPVNIEFASAFLYQVSPGTCNIREPNMGFPRDTQFLLHGWHFQIEQIVWVEPFLKGEFVKANNNCGFVAKHSHETAEFFQVAQAFSHWTWVASEKSLLICDLQGVFQTSEGEKKWKFTDPAIHSASQRFGQTDLGPQGINAFFYYHICNGFCRHLPRPSGVIDVALPPVAPHTAFSFELAQVSAAVHCQQRFANILNHADSGTCYAHAAATVVRAAERRIVGRKLEDHYDMVRRLVDKYGTKGHSVKPILEEECSPRKLQCKEVDTSGAAQAIDLGRAILLSFALTDAQWTDFSVFFKRAPSATLNSDSLSDSLGGKFARHAVVIVGHDDLSWKIKNSWGDSFADGGYFQMSKSLVLDCNPEFYDIFWYEHDLTEDDLAAYKAYCEGSNLHSVSPFRRVKLSPWEKA